MRHLILVFMLVLVFPLLAQNPPAAPTPIQLTTSQVEAVQQWAQIYQLALPEALDKYRDLIGFDYQKALDALDYFKTKETYEIAAAALSDVRVSNLTGELIHVMERAETFSPVMLNAAIRELEKLNEVEYTDDGEHTAGVETMKANLATLIAKWLGIVDPKLLRSHSPDTRPEYADFIATARQRAVATPTSSPG